MNKEARSFCSEVKELAKKYNLDFFVVTEGASSYSCSKNTEAVKEARKSHVKWESSKGFDPLEDWAKNEKA